MTYHLKLQGMVGDDGIERLARGLALGGAAGQAESPSSGWPPPSKNTWIEMVVAEIAAARAEGGGRV